MTAEFEILWDVIDEHLSEADFLVEQWQAAMGSPRLSVVDVQRTIERRLDAHLDGLVVGGSPVAKQTLHPALMDDPETTPTRAAAAALALLAGGTTASALAERLGVGAPPTVAAGVATALRISSRSDVDEPLRLALYSTDDLQTQSAILSALAARQIDPGPIAGALLARRDPQLTPLVLTALGVADQARFRNLVEDCLTGEPEPRAEAALRTALVWNLASAWRLCPAAARAGSPAAMLALALFGRPAELAPLWAALQAPQHRSAALFAVGFSGYCEAVEACLPFVADEDAQTAALAAEAIAAITGLPLFESPFADIGDTKKDERSTQLPPLEQDLREDLFPAAHTKLPKPHPPAYRTWWTGHQERFRPGERYHYGQPRAADVLAWAMDTRSLRRRGVLAFDIAVRTGGRLRIPSVRLSQGPVSLPPDLPMHRPPVWL